MHETGQPREEDSAQRDEFRCMLHQVQYFICVCGSAARFTDGEEPRREDVKRVFGHIQPYVGQCSWATRNEAVLKLAQSQSFTPCEQALEFHKELVGRPFNCGKWL